RIRAPPRRVDHAHAVVLPLGKVRSRPTVHHEDHAVAGDGGEALARAQETMHGGPAIAPPSGGTRADDVHGVDDPHRHATRPGAPQRWARALGSATGASGGRRWSLRSRRFPSLPRTGCVFPRVST